MPDTEQEYRQLVDTMVRDTENDLVFQMSSQRNYRKHRNYEGILQHGNSVVPYIFIDLANNRGDHLLDLLDDLLPSVHLGEKYDNLDFRMYPDQHRALWLRWWNEIGSKQQWK